MSVVVYSKNHCPYCVYAKELLDKLSVPYQEIRVDQDLEALRYMLEASGRRTVPQIFIHNQPIGGFDDLSALHQKGALIELINNRDEE